MKITFHGGAREIGASCTVVETDDVRVALDYGIKVDTGLSYTMPEDLDAVMVTHAHLDHSGNLLTLSDKEIAVIGSQPTRDVTLHMLRDLIKIHRLNGTPVPFSHHSVRRLARRWISRTPLAFPGMEVSTLPAGHVLGARMAHLKTHDKSVLYTGDFCLHDTEILDGVNPKTLPQAPDVLIMESTYGGTIRPPRDVLVEQLFTKIQETIDREGNVLIPAFAFHRLQEMAQRIEHAMVTKMLPRYNVYYISGLAHRLFSYYDQYKTLLSDRIRRQAKPFKFRRVRRLRKTEQIKEPAIVICTSGFGHAGPSASLLYDWAGDEANSVIINTGYLPPESPLLMAKEGVIAHNGTSIDVHADVSQIELSGHGDQEDLTNFVATLKPKQTFLVHGDIKEAEALSRKIGEYTDVTIPRNHEKYVV
jgi:Cft2 family RNA processing exonuclease